MIIIDKRKSPREALKFCTSGDETTINKTIDCMRKKQNPNTTIKESDKKQEDTTKDGFGRDNK